MPRVGGVRLRYNALVGTVWMALLLRGLFYCVEQPIWEGFDEWAHFAYIQHFAEYHQIPSRTDPASSELQRSLELVPLSRLAAEAVPGAVTHEAFWHLPAKERIRRSNELLGLSPQYHVNDASLIARQYEAQQPPLYYVILAPVYLLVKPLSLPSQVLALRIVSLLIASSIVFLGSYKSGVHAAGLAALGRYAPEHGPCSGFVGLLEPVEGKFDYSLVDGLIREARAHDLHLVLLWFGSWKNTWSSYTPDWVKRDFERFPRVQLRNGSGTERLTPFS